MEYSLAEIFFGSGVALSGCAAEVGPVRAAGHGILPGDARQTLQGRTRGLGHEVRRK